MRTPSSSPQQRWILVAAVLGSSLTFIDGSALGVALPKIQHELNAGPAAVQWVSNAYLLMLGSLVLVGGSAGDLFGRRRVFLLGVGLFTMASVACGLAPSIEFLVAARSVQGLGAALLTPGALALIGVNFPPDQRGRAFGTWAGFGSLTAMVGPLVGGVLADRVSWRAIFWINVPLAAVAMVLTLRHVPESRDQRARRLDLPGALLAACGLGALTWGLTAAPDLGFDTPSIRLALGSGVLLLVAFVLVERRVRAPMVPLDLFASKVFSGTNALTFLLYFALGGAMFFLPFDLIRVQGFSATKAGAAMLPFAVVMGTLSGAAGRLADRVGAKLSLSLGPALAGAGLFALGVPGRGAGYVTGPLVGMTILAIGMTLAVGPLTAAVMAAVQPEHAGVASGINNAVARVAGLLAVTLLGLVLSFAFASRAGGPDARQVLGQVMSGASLDAAAIEAFHRAFRVLMTVCAGCAVASAVIGLLTAPGRKQPEPAA